MAGAVWRCFDCRRRVSSTAGTVFQDTRTPLTIWFAAAWSLTTQKNGISALGLQRVLGVGSYQTTWAMLHRVRTAMVRPGRELLFGDVEVDETFIGGVKPGKRGRGAAGKVLVAIAVEQRSPKGFGRARMAIIPDAAAPALQAFLQAHVEYGSVVITDGLKSYPGAIGHDFKHKPSNMDRSGQPAHVPLPGVYRVAALVKRWLLGTYQGAVSCTPTTAKRGCPSPSRTLPRSRTKILAIRSILPLNSFWVYTQNKYNLTLPHCQVPLDTVARP